VHKVSLGDFVSRLVGPARWLAEWFVLFALSATFVPYFDNGPPNLWPSPLRAAMEVFLAPGGLFWIALFWHPFGDGPTGTESVFIVLVNSMAWLIFLYVAIWILGRLRARR
jgi:hypothetical protein